jgi:hypothetical protein
MISAVLTSGKRIADFVCAGDCRIFVLMKRLLIDGWILISFF